MKDKIVNLLAGVNILQFPMLPDNEIWVSPAMFEQFKKIMDEKKTEI